LSRFTFLKDWICEMPRLNLELYDRDNETFNYARRLLGVDSVATLRKALKFWRMVLETEAKGGFYGFVEAETSNLLILGRYQRSFSTHKKLSPNRFGIYLRDSTQEDLEKIMLLDECIKRVAVCRALDAWRDVLEAHENHLDIVYKSDTRTEPLLTVILPF